MASKNITFLYINAFSQSGGIQEFNKNFISSLVKLSKEEDYTYFIISLRDASADLPAYPSCTFVSAQGNRLLFMAYALWYGMKSFKIICGHLYLSFPLIYLFRSFGKYTILITHGIEIWNLRSKFLKEALHQFSEILSVSNYTTHKIVENHSISKHKITLFPNTANALFLSLIPAKSTYLHRKYAFHETDKILLTVCRIAPTEVEKGYDQVILSLPEVLKKIPNIRYIVAGKSEPAELERLKMLVQSQKLEKHVFFPGPLTQEELISHYSSADLFVMPSRKEGFGIVFIEAILCGCPVIGGNIDGTKEAVLLGEAGYLVNPLSKKEITQAMVDFFQGKWPPHLYDLERSATLVKKSFGTESFRERLKMLLRHHITGK